MKRILIAIPCMDDVKTAFAASLAMLQAPPDTEITIHTLQNSLIYDSRNRLASYAVSHGFDYVLWLDSDMGFKSSTLIKLYDDIRMVKDSIISGLYFRRVRPYSPVIFKTCNAETCKWEGYDDYPKDDLFEVEGVGFGCILMDIQVFLDIAAEQKNAGFFNPFLNFGEDLAFCTRARKQGYHIYVDSRIKCTHYGTIGVSEELFEAMKGAKNEN